jgi:hypothetical protein
MNTPTQSQTNTDKRTDSQNRALHLFFQQVADTLNKDGISMTMLLQRFIIETPATKTAIKELVWKPLQQALYGKTSTTELLKREEIDRIYMAMNKFFADELKTSLPPFPSLEEINFQQTYGTKK